MAIVVVQNLAPGGAGTNQGTPASYTPPAPFTVGNTILLGFSSYSLTGQATSVTVGGNAGTRDRGGSAGNEHIEIWRVSSLASAGDLLVNWSGDGSPDGNFILRAVLEVSGLEAAPVDQNPTITTGTSAAPSIVSGVTTQDDELVFAVCQNRGSNNVTITQPGGYTPIENNGNWTTDASGAMAYLIVAAAGAQTATWGFSAINNWSCAMVTYKGSASAPAVVAPTPLQVLTFGANF